MPLPLAEKFWKISQLEILRRRHFDPEIEENGKILFNLTRFSLNLA